MTTALPGLRTLFASAAMVGMSTGTQQTAAAATVARADSVCMMKPAVADSALAVASAVMEPADPRMKLPAEFLSFVLDAVRRHYHAPRVLALPVMSRTFLQGTANEPGGLDSAGRVHLPARALPNMYVHAYFALHDDGPPSDIAIGGGSLSRELEAGVLAAIRALTPSDVGPLPGNAHAIFISLKVNGIPATSPLPPALFSALVPVYTVEKIPQLVSDPVEYPRWARDSAVTDTVAIRFVVDAAGKAVPNSAELRSGRYPAFTDAMLLWLRGARFSSAIANGCPVPMTAQYSAYFHSGAVGY